MPTLTIDGREIEVPEGTTILQAALACGIEIPHYCYHPGLSIAGNCRICLVEIEKAPKPSISCNTVVTDGMVVHTQSEKVKQWQNGVMEFLLINHPLDCPICDQAGECKLQDYSYRFGKPTTRFIEEKVHGPKRRELGPHVVFDWERCIKCTRCIRFCEEISKTRELGMFLRGVREEIGIFPGKPLDNPYSGNVVDLCPVGALTLKEFRFRSRVWFLSNVPSVCPGCARGCSVDLGIFRNEILRITPRENPEVNQWWICDTGRLWGQRLQSGAPHRLSGPRGSEQESPDPWAACLGEAIGFLKTTPRDKVRILASPRATVEETWLLASIAKALEAPVYLPSHEAGEDDALLIRRDKSPNLRGAEAVLKAIVGAVHTSGELEQALRRDEVEVLLALGPGLNGPTAGEPLPLDPGALARAKVRIVLDSHASSLSAAATVLLPCTSYAESSGAFVNFSGRLQCSPKALTPPVDCRPAAMILGDLWAGLEEGIEPPGTPVIRESLSQTVPEFAEVEWEELPASTGQLLPGF